MVHPNICNVTLYNVAPSLISQNPREWMCLVQTSLLVFPQYNTFFDIKIIHQSILTACLHVSCCHRFHNHNVDFVLFHTVTCYTNSYYHVSMLILQISSYHVHFD